MRFLTCVGDATSIATHGGLPYHLLHAGLQAGFLDGGWSLQPQKLRARRILWNAGRLLTCGEYGGYQYASSFLRALIRQEPRASSIHDEVISIFPLLPPDCPRRAGVSFYIDATLQQNFEDYGITRSVGRAMITEALARERQAYRDAARILCRSRAAARSVVGVYGIEPNKVHVVPGGANIIGDPGPSRYGPDNLPLVPVRLGFVGKDWQRKNLPFVLKIADVLNARGIAVEVIAAGFSIEHGPRHPLLRSVGFIDKRHALNAFVDLLRSCHFNCLFSFAEAFGLSNRESLRLGVPVLASNVGGIPDTVPAGCGHLFAPDADAADVADIIEGYARDAGRYWQLRDAVGRRTREFTWLATVERMQHIWAGSTAYRFRDEGASHA